MSVRLDLRLPQDSADDLYALAARRQRRPWALAAELLTAAIAEACRPAPAPRKRKAAPASGVPGAAKPEVHAHASPTR